MSRMPVVPLDAAELTRQLLALDDPAAQRRVLFDHLPCFDPTVAEQLKNLAVRTRLASTQQALAIAQLILDAAAATGDVRCRGYGLWASAIVHALELGLYAAALDLYDEAIAIFARLGDALSPALMQISRLWALANLNRHDEVARVGEQAAQVLAAQEKWLPLASLQMNLGAALSRRGEDIKALAKFEAARQAYEALGGATDAEIAPLWASAVNNCAISRCYLGDFEGAMADSRTALAVQERVGNWVEAARIKQRQGVTYFIQGHFNAALNLLQAAQAVFVREEMHRHAARLELDICDCLLRLRRFDEVILKSAYARELFRRVQTLHEEGLAVLYTAMAHAGLNQDEEALTALEEAAALFAQEGSAVWCAYADLERAALLRRQGRHAESLALAQRCADLFRQEAKPVKEAEAQLHAAHALAALGEGAAAAAHLVEVCALGEAKDVGDLNYRGHHALGTLARDRGDLAATAEHFAAAISALERLRGRLMVEYRVNFQEDKQVVYEDMVDLCLTLNQPAQGLAYAERAKSRALLDLLDYRVDLRVRPHSPADQPLVEQLLALRAARDRRYRRWENHEEATERGSVFQTDGEEVAAVRELERQIADLWHTLLIRNSAYAQDADLWQVASRPELPAVDPDTLLVEYFSIRGELVVFLVGAAGVTAQRLGVTVPEVRGWVERLGRQMRAVPRFPAAGRPGLIRQAQVVLHALYTALVAPVADKLADYAQLVIVPHDVLHYVPFQALYDGQRYLIEAFALSYLPSAGLAQRRRSTPAPASLLAVGYSANGALPSVRGEIDAIAALFPAQVLTETAATAARLRELAPQHGILHFATHAEMHDQQPLFSGLLLEEGWLTTLDVFNLELRAALVTLSACQTGRSVIGGGDELLGLMRAFFYAGADSLVMSTWAVEDRATAALMGVFYGQLAQGKAKRAALRHAQLHLLRGGAGYTHPYFWAPFFLAGDPGPLLLDRNPSSGQSV